MWYLFRLGLRLLACFLLLFSLPSIERVLLQASLFITSLPARVLFDATVEGTVIRAGSVSVEYVSACAATLAYVLLALLIFLTANISPRKGNALFLSGSLFILVANVIRINYLLYILLAYGVNYFQQLHLFLWNMVSTVYVVGVWIVLTKVYRVASIPIVTDFIILRKMLLRKR